MIRTECAPGGDREGPRGADAGPVAAAVPPHPPGNQDQGRRPPSNTSPPSAFPLLRKRTLLGGVESKVSIWPEGVEAQLEKWGDDGGRKRGTQEGSSGFREGGWGFLAHPLRPLGCGQAECFLPKRRRPRSRGLGLPSRGARLRSVVPGARRRERSARLHRARTGRTRGALGRAGLGGSRGDSERLGRRLNVRRKKVAKPIFQARCRPPPPRAGCGGRKSAAGGEGGRAPSRRAQRGPARAVRTSRWGPHRSGAGPRMSPH